MIAFSSCVVCLALVGGPSGPEEPTKVGYRSFNLPLRVEPGSKKSLKEVSLWVSRDQGKTWQRYAKVAPDAGQIRFDADRDGEYWFAVQTTDDKGHKSPTDVAKAAPSLKVVVDTKAKKQAPTPPDTSSADDDELEAEYDQVQEAIKRWEKRVAELEDRKREKLKKGIEQLRDKLDKLKQRARELEKDLNEDDYTPPPPVRTLKPLTPARP